MNFPYEPTIECCRDDKVLWAKTWSLHFSTSSLIDFKSIRFWLNTWNKVCLTQTQDTFTIYSMTYNTSVKPLVILLKLLPFLKKAVVNKCLKETI